MRELSLESETSTVDDASSQSSEISEESTKEKKGFVVTEFKAQLDEQGKFGILCHIHC